MTKSPPSENELITYIDYRLSEIDKSIKKSFLQKFGVWICAVFIVSGIPASVKIEEYKYYITSFIVLCVSILPFVFLEIYKIFTPSYRWNIEGIPDLQDKFSKYQLLFEDLLNKLQKNTSQISSIKAACTISASEIKSKDKNILTFAKASGLLGCVSFIWNHFFAKEFDNILENNNNTHNGFLDKIQKFFEKYHVTTSMEFAVADVLAFISITLFIVFLLQKQSFSRRERAIDFANQLVAAATSKIGVKLEINT